jgi:hypothetical protein
MDERKLILLNTSVLTNYGTFVYEAVSLEQVRKLISEYQQSGKIIESAIGHASTAELLSLLLEFPVAVNRTEFKQTSDDLALIFKLKQRVTENKVLTREELEAIGYEFGLLKRVES